MMQMHHLLPYVPIIGFSWTICVGKAGRNWLWGQSMKLGILVNTDKHLEHILGLTKATIAKHHEVIIFIMDEGTRLSENELIVALAKQPAVSISLCEHSAKSYGIDTKNLSRDINCASQFNNAMMNHDADRVIVL